MPLLVLCVQVHLRDDGPVRRRLVQLYVGLVLFGVSVAMVIRATLGNAPWDVLHQGLARTFGLGTGVWSIIVSFLLLVLWIPLRERPGLGTISNALVVGLVLQLFLDHVPDAEALPVQLALLFGGVGLNALAGGMYIGARFGAGPRDGLMTGVNRRYGLPLGPVRTSIEITVLISGWLLGGTVGVGTVVYALGIGPLVAMALPRLTVPVAPAEPPPSRTAPSSAARPRGRPSPGSSGRRSDRA